MDDQHIEGVHPQFNQLVRRFGNTRGRRRQELVINEFLFSHSTWITETVDDMLRKTKRRKVRGEAEERENNTAAPSNLVEDTLAVDPVDHTHAGGEVGIQMEVSEEELWPKLWPQSNPPRAATIRRR